ncbi:hypothetical protein BDQ17DRAFT_1232391 [Cyathus striatus]|nr:hypothetical protein BDQ17DRAFT_1232391 [Cyathus striatus]
MGHIAPHATWELISEGLISGIELTDTDEPLQCDVCIQVKASHCSVPKERYGPQAKAFGEEVHPDIWEPADTETLGH